MGQEALILRVGRMCSMGEWGGSRQDEESPFALQTPLLPC